LSESETSGIQAELGEPKLPPVKVIICVPQEVHLCSHVASELLPISDSLELNESRDNQEEDYTEEIEIEGNDLVSQPDHDWHIICDIITIIVGDTTLDEENTV
jgi:hypothetical protein